MAEKNKNEIEIKQYYYRAIFLIIVAITLSSLAFYGVFKPIKEPLEVWFQRSGSIMTIFAIIADFCLFKAHNIFNPAGLGISTTEELKTKYNNKYSFLSFFAVAITITGTVIWGYGDLMHIWMKQ
jgi:hypothetical protein